MLIIMKTIYCLFTYYFIQPYPLRIGLIFTSFSAREMI